MFQARSAAHSVLQPLLHLLPVTYRSILAVHGSSIHAHHLGPWGLVHESRGTDTSCIAGRRSSSCRVACCQRCACHLVLLQVAEVVDLAQHVGGGQPVLEVRLDRVVQLTLLVLAQVSLFELVPQLTGHAQLLVQGALILGGEGEQIHRALAGSSVQLAPLGGVARGNPTCQHSSRPLEGHHEGEELLRWQQAEGGLGAAAERVGTGAIWTTQLAAPVSPLQHDWAVPLVGHVQPHSCIPQVRQLPLIARVERGELQEAAVSNQDGGAQHTKVEDAVMAAGDDNSCGSSNHLHFVAALHPDYLAHSSHHDGAV
mmetsp:Transcript_38085/g.84837  ORF Transcript_38085/g.84837 Transcript_38085/m.84837 type:complete len:313 (-) Transcript_38085:1232-2170(-)